MVIGEELMPISVTFEYQRFKEKEIIDNIENPQVEPFVDINSITSICGFEISDIITANTVEHIRKHCFNHMSKAIS